MCAGIGWLDFERARFAGLGSTRRPTRAMHWETLAAQVAAAGPAEEKSAAKPPSEGAIAGLGGAAGGPGGGQDLGASEKTRAEAAMIHAEPSTTTPDVLEEAVDDGAPGGGALGEQVPPPELRCLGLISCRREEFGPAKAAGALLVRAGGGPLRSFGDAEPQETTTSPPAAAEEEEATGTTEHQGAAEEEEPRCVAASSSSSERAFSGSAEQQQEVRAAKWVACLGLLSFPGAAPALARCRGVGTWAEQATVAGGNAAQQRQSPPPPEEQRLRGPSAHAATTEGEEELAAWDGTRERPERGGVSSPVKSWLLAAQAKLEQEGPVEVISCAVEAVWLRSRRIVEEAVDQVAAQKPGQFSKDTYQASARILQRMRRISGASVAILRGGAVEKEEKAGEED